MKADEIVCFVWMCARAHHQYLVTKWKAQQSVHIGRIFQFFPPFEKWKLEQIMKLAMLLKISIEKKWRCKNIIDRTNERERENDKIRERAKGISWKICWTKNKQNYDCQPLIYFVRLSCGKQSNWNRQTTRDAICFYVIKHATTMEIWTHKNCRLNPNWWRHKYSWCFLCCTNNDNKIGKLLMCS